MRTCPTTAGVLHTFSCHSHDAIFTVMLYHTQEKLLVFLLYVPITRGRLLHGIDASSDE